ncbi:helix-turn-helix transcriptional regulator [Mangrovihabitans endophyticus]|uniref:LuxR family transcriptional regulator n=1 Tax=Mangrovihabitans endophyticus TaxID=1751298 RepID=A0A8J3BX11_9ACTN|nr:LuxR family transcriptional regulator [Mangrovihabitans endophyticus]GGK87172.1 LuxR family transcriptional regulator [Mangrovihabitans endophyticus]
MGLWVFVGRDDEKSRLTSAVTGPGRGLVLSGTAGLGKSRLLQEVVAALPSCQYAVHVATATLASSGLPFGGVAQMLPPGQPTGLSPAGLLRWAVDTLHAEAGERPLVLAVDDLHLLDPPSAALVHLLVREGATLLGTVRTAERVPSPLMSLWTEGLVRHAELRPLTAGESAELLAAMLGGPVHAGSADRLVRLAGGNPLLLRELVMAAADGSEMTESYGVWRWTGRLCLAPSLADLVDTRIGTLTPGVRQVLELVAFGEPIGLSALLDATDADDVEAAEERGLITVLDDGRRRNVHLGHPLYGEVVRRGCPRTRGRRLLATLADMVDGTGARRRGDLLRTAVWRIDSGTRMDGGRLLDAAAQAFARFDLELAQRLGEAAGDAGAGYPASELVATALLFADQPERAVAVLDAAETRQAAGARLRTAHASVAFWGLGRTDAPDRLGAVAADDPGDGARMTAVEALMRLQMRQLTPARAGATRALTDPAADAPTRDIARCVLAFLAATGGDPATATDLIADVTTNTSAWRWDAPALGFALPIALGTRVSITYDLDGIDEILAAEFAGLAHTGGFGVGAGWISLLQAHAAWLRGRTGEALQATNQACAALSANRLYDGNAHAARANAAAIRGDIDLAHESMAVADGADASCAGLYYPWRSQARVWTAACAGDVPTAIRHLLELIIRLRTDGFHGHELLALYDLTRLGRPELAAARMSTLLAGTPGTRMTAMMLRHTRAAADGCGEQLLAVSRELQAHGYMVFAAEAAAVAARTFRAARDPQALAASTLLGDILARCDTMRTPALRTVGPSLTSRERQVAELAADGAKSKEIADALYLSPRTVENHLQRVYGKLGVNRRGELAPALRSLPKLQ